MLCGDKVTVGPFDNPFVALTGRCTVCVCVDNQTTGHNQNILSSQLQYTAQSNQISLTHNNNCGTIKLVENQHCCGGKSDKMWHGHSDWIVISQISFDGVHTAQQHQVIADDAGGKRKRYFRSNIRWIFFSSLALFDPVMSLGHWGQFNHLSNMTQIPWQPQLQWQWKRQQQ